MTSQKACRDLDALLSAYVDHEATAEEMAAVEAHALGCAACAARLKGYQALTPRLEADIRALLFKAEAAAGPARRPRFNGLMEMTTLGAPLAEWFGRAATFAVDGSSGSKMSGQRCP